jgi:hypothetical protein
MSQWTDILTAREMAESRALTARLDPAFATAQHAFYTTRSASELRALAQQAWLTNDPTQYQVARSYLALLQISA